jgi:lipoprotein signal peptidase
MVGLLAFGGMFLLLDHWSKNLAEIHTTGQSITCGRLLRIRCVTHRLMSLSAARMRIVLPLLWLTALACAFVLHSSGAWFKSRSALFGLALAFGGAAGNLMDLLRRHYVLDFIDLCWWPVFNLADVGILLARVYCELSKEACKRPFLCSLE